MELPNSTNPVVLSRTNCMPFGFFRSSQRPAMPMAPNRYEAPVWCPWPAFTISLAATLSGKGRSASTTSVRRSTITKSTPSTPPTSMIAVLWK